MTLRRKELFGKRKVVLYSGFGQHVWLSSLRRTP